MSHIIYIICFGSNDNYRYYNKTFNKNGGKQIMTEYIICKFKNACFYLNSNDTIYLGIENSKSLTSDELIEYMSDCIIHEYTHKVLNDLFNNDVSKLFDAIEYLFRNDELHKKALKRRITYQTYINRHGFNQFLLNKQITRHDFIGARILCEIPNKTMLQHGGL